MTPESQKLNLGCGYKKLYDHWNVDVEPRCNPDQVWDLDTTPWPWEDNFFNRITADNILEHLGQNPRVFTEIIKEMYRVSQDRAEWFICVPHHRCDLFWDDYTHVRPLSAKTFQMFDQKLNFSTIERKLSESTFGIYHNVDLEVYDVNYNIIPYWRGQVEQGLLGSQQLDINLNTMSNVCETVNIFIRVHKPGRCQDLVDKMNQREQ
jgi:predicted SAM-dependent methyltransferase